MTDHAWYSLADAAWSIIARLLTSTQPAGRDNQALDCLHKAVPCYLAWLD